jgi:hypothetical protein
MRLRGQNKGVAVVALTLTAACGEPGSVDAGLGESDAGALSDASRGLGFADVLLPDPATFADVSVPVNFNDPVWLPAPDANIEGDVTDLIGSWAEVNSDGTLCTPAKVGQNNASCLHLDIQRGDSGGVVGTVYADRVMDPVSGLPLVSGPFAKATDGNVGYPTTVPPSAYFYAEQLCPDVDYRVLDGIVNNGSLSFWFSPYDLWTDWCALQTPSAWNVDGAQKYRCVAQTATPSNTDLGKLALCSSGSDGPTCTLSDGTEEPCACVDDAGAFADAPGLCFTSPVCECSSSQCRANLRARTIVVTLDLTAGKLVGSSTLPDLGGTSDLTLQKVAGQ